ncbi:prolipoprotein diacylglyceryl transferase [Salinactinospora qingdaonensis]|uniref:Signal transducing protein n=1 Tax=Salinactinospora qingdaonensis TaxID=702744 RepID=A0ABP7FCH2_9ACTN
MTHRRGNGLLADTYIPFVLLSPDLADVMLDALRHAGVAAYAIPLGDDPLGDRALEGEKTDEGGAATDRLYVDAAEREAAERILGVELPGLTEPRTGEAPEPSELPERLKGGETATTGQRGDDDVWADLVARFYTADSGTTAGEWPDAENVPAAEEATAPDATSDADSFEDVDHEPSAGEGRVVRPAEPHDDPEEHYIPPPPPPLPRGDLVSRLSWAGLFGGPLVLLAATLLGLNLPDWLAFCAVAGFITGFIVLVVRMGDRPPRDSGPDDGAVI